jgi:hypothetical protein
LILNEYGHFANGSWPTDYADPPTAGIIEIVCAIFANGIKPDLVIGDLDSISAMIPNGSRIISEPANFQEEGPN